MIPPTVPLDGSLAAYQRARTRAAMASYFERRAVDLLVFDAREAGMSTREIAALVELPKSTVARLGRPSGRDVGKLPFPRWATEEEWLSAYTSIWPDHGVTQAPFVVDSRPGEVTYRMRYRPNSAIDDGADDDGLGGPE